MCQKVQYACCHFLRWASRGMWWESVSKGMRHQRISKFTPIYVIHSFKSLREVIPYFTYCKYTKYKAGNRCKAKRRCVVTGRVTRQTLSGVHGGSTVGYFCLIIRETTSPQHQYPASPPTDSQKPTSSISKTRIRRRMHNL